MKNPSCLIMLIAFPLAALGIAALLYFRRLGLAPETHPLEVLGQSAGVGAAAGFFAMLALLWVFCGWRKYREIGVLARCDRGRLTDGEPAVVRGRILPAGPVIEDPFSGGECLLFRYQISHWTRGTSSGRSHFYDALGIGMTSCVVRNQRVSVKLLGFPLLDFAGTRIEDLGRAREYVASADLSPRRTVYPEQEHELRLNQLEEGGTLRYELVSESWDRRFPEPESEDYERELEVKVVRPGEEVCIVGRYSAAHGGLVPEASYRSDLQIRLLKGRGERIRQVLTRRTAGYLLLASAAATAAWGLGWLFLTGRLHEILGW
ncbi:MAG: hypothetical protein GY856_43515 [bacterium]|nr:hypothetical protein [bacterium]